MEKCKECGSENLIEKFVTHSNGTKHLEVRCGDCGRFQQYKKYSAENKTKEEYRKEYYQKMGWKYYERKQ